MESPVSLSELAAVEALLARLDPEPRPCRVPGCVHLRDTPDRQEGAPTALAA